MSDSDALSLPAIEASVWQGLNQASTSSASPWRLPVLATADTAGPHARTIVLRSVDVAARVLMFHTDVRSPKVGQLQTEPRVSLVFYDSATQVQLCVRGLATIHTNDLTADQQWRGTPPSSRRAYLAPEPPGTLSATPCVNLPDTVLGRIPSESELTVGRENFAVIAVATQEVDWLKLDRQGSLRAMFGYVHTSGIVVADDGQWVAP